MTDNDNLSRRRFLQATGGAATAVSLAGCLDDLTSSSGGAGNTLQLLNSTMSTLDPVKSTDTASGTVVEQVYDGLMDYPDGEVAAVEAVAKDYEVSDDFTTYTFNLKEGVKFHNGDEVTAQDFVYSFERLAASENSRRAYFILDSIGVKHETEGDSYKPGSLAVEAVDDYTLKIELAEPFHSTIEMLAYSSFSVIPEGIVGDIEGYDGEMEYKKFSNDSPVGCGPFEFDTWESDNEAKVVKYDDYHGETAKVDGVHWKISSDPDAQHTYGFVNKNADATVYMPTAKYDPDKVNIENTDDLGRKTGTYGPTAGDATMNYQATATINAFYIGFNAKSVEKPVRQAVAYAVNQQEVANEIFKGRVNPGYHFTPPNIYPGGANEYTKHAEENYPYGYNEGKLDKAREVMEDAGYGADNRASFTFTVYESSDTWAELGKLLRDQLASAHIDMEVERAPFSTLLKRGRNGNLEAYSLGWIMDWPAPDNFLQLLNPPQTDTSKDAPTAYTNWLEGEQSKRAEEAWQTVQDNPAPTEEAQQKRNEAYVEIEEANWEDVIFLNMYHRIDERWWYDWLDLPKFGGAGTSRQKYNKVELGERDK